MRACASAFAHARRDGGLLRSSGFDAGAQTYFEQHPTWGGSNGFLGGVVWPLLKFLLVLGVLYRGATDPRVKVHAMRPPRYCSFCCSACWYVVSPRL